jgi:hypothetical protein
MSYDRMYSLFKHEIERANLTAEFPPKWLERLEKRSQWEMNC